MKNVLILIVSCFLFIFGNGQNGSGFIHWDSTRPLTWEDFQNQPPAATGNVAALTVTRLGFSYSFTNGKLTFSIECKFEKGKSWGQVKNDWILAHEQGHFDIAEIYARKLYKELNAYTFNRNSFEKDLGDIYQLVVSEKDAYQQQYDRETDHSRNKEKQEEWFKKISGLLQQLKEWAGYS